MDPPEFVGTVFIGNCDRGILGTPSKDPVSFMSITYGD